MPVLRPEYAPLFKESIFHGKTAFHFAGKCSYPGDIMAAEIRLFPCLTDNFGYLIHDPATKATASIDAPEAAPIIKALEREGWTLTDILGTYHQMWDSLLKLRALPDDFKLYCGHEYTAANVKFALTVEPDNAALRARAEQVTRLRADNKPTVPTLLGEEKKANVFLRADEPSVAAGVRLKGRGAAEVFGELRERKNKS